MLILERDPQQRGLPAVFIPQEPRRVMPSDIAEEIILVHTVQPPTASFPATNNANVVGAAAVIQVDSNQPAPSHYFWCHAISGEHNDPVARVIGISLRHVANNSNVSLVEPASRTQGQQLATTRSILVPRGWVIRVNANALAAGQVLTLRMMFVEYLEAENHPAV